jgi:predicted ABC-class ATPase
MSRKRKIAVLEGHQVRIYTNADEASFKGKDYAVFPDLKKFKGIPMHHLTIKEGKLLLKGAQEQADADKYHREFQHKADFIARKGTGIINWKQVIKLAISFIIGFGIAWLIF